MRKERYTRKIKGGTNFLFRLKAMDKSGEVIDEIPKGLFVCKNGVVNVTSKVKWYFCEGSVVWMHVVK